MSLLGTGIYLLGVTQPGVPVRPITPKPIDPGAPTVDKPAPNNNPRSLHPEIVPQAPWIPTTGDPFPEFQGKGPGTPPMPVPAPPTLPPGVVVPGTTPPEKSHVAPLQPVQPPPEKSFVPPLPGGNVVPFGKVVIN